MAQKMTILPVLFMLVLALQSPKVLLYNLPKCCRQKRLVKESRPL